MAKKKRLWLRMLREEKEVSRRQPEATQTTHPLMNLEKPLDRAARLRRAAMTMMRQTRLNRMVMTAWQAQVSGHRCNPSTHRATH